MTRTMPRTLFLAAALALTGGTAAAQDFTFGWNPRSGDVWVDTQLTDINRYGMRYREPFVDELVRYRGAPRDLVVDLLARNWAPGDIYYACTIAQILGRPCRYVVEEYERNHGEGWGALAKRLGVKPGSPEFHRLKQGFVPTYQRWGRPIRIDDADRGTHASGKGGPAKGAARADRGARPNADHGPARGGGHDGKPGKVQAAAHHGPAHGAGAGGGKGGKGQGNGQGKGKGKGKD